MKYNETWIPVTESGEHNTSEFDLIFSIDRTFITKSLFKKIRIRFVKYPNINDGYVKIYITKMLKLPRFYWFIVEKYMKHFIPENIIFKNYEYIMSCEEVYKKMNYIINEQYLVVLRRREKINRLKSLVH
jgi:hypothetical protein